MPPQVCVATFDSTIHFYSLRPGQAQPHMLVVPDVTDVYCPLAGNIVVDLAQCRDLVRGGWGERKGGRGTGHTRVGPSVVCTKGVLPSLCKHSCWQPAAVSTVGLRTCSQPPP